MKLRRYLLPTALATLLGVTTSACMGSFALTKMLYNFNESVTGNKIINNLVFWALNIVPVYSLAVTGDVVILNLIEFWTGNNLLAQNLSDSNARMAKLHIEQDQHGVVTIQQGEQSFSLTPLDERRVLVATPVQTLGIAEFNEDGSVTIFDQAGRSLRTIDVAEFEASKAQLAQLTR